MTATIRLTTAQALIRFLKNQYVERDGVQNPFFAGVLGIFGHGNIAGIGQALQENPDFKYIMVRNEQAAVHIASGYTKMKNRLQTFACTSYWSRRYQHGHRCRAGHHQPAAGASAAG